MRLRSLVSLIVILWRFPQICLASKFPISPDCEVISVRDKDELAREHLAILTSKEKCVLFRIESSGTYLARKPKKKALFKVPLKKLLKITARARLGGGSGSLRSPILRGLVKVHDEWPWIEFFLGEFENRTMSRHQPISFCHSETRGEGSLVSFQVTHTLLPTVGGTYTGDLSIFNLALTLTADVALEKAIGKALKARCAVGRGEVGQLFLTNTRYLYYTPYFRYLLYDARIKRFLGGDKEDDFKRWGRERAILRGGLGEFVCASNAVVDLKCHGLSFNMSMSMPF